MPRKQYNTLEKRPVLEYLQTHTPKETALHFGIHLSMVYKWRYKSESILSANERSVKPGAGRKPFKKTAKTDCVEEEEEIDCGHVETSLGKESIKCVEGMDLLEEQVLADHTGELSDDIYKQEDISKDDLSKAEEDMSNGGSNELKDGSS